MSDPQKFRKKPVVIEAMPVLAYTELLPPAEWNDFNGGRVWKWMHDNGVEVRCGQVDPGPRTSSSATCWCVTA